ncbi:hypothetical protein B2J93_3183 [Marssonina coronariae]|uniref:Uncharacterized protein n=1 Tax=Diplocarpon coronariae TaxID=2795749 RepID=A0A218Z563_9HELO|nr:hypothetical protein B2J93_3183 [Marssonina coronariae]
MEKGNPKQHPATEDNDSEGANEAESEGAEESDEYQEPGGYFEDFDGGEVGEEGEAPKSTMFETAEFAEAGLSVEEQIDEALWDDSDDEVDEDKDDLERLEKTMRFERLHEAELVPDYR